jgi:hypothetical protein
MGMRCLLKADAEQVRLRRVLRQQSENRQHGGAWKSPCLLSKKTEARALIHLEGQWGDGIRLRLSQPSRPGTNKGPYRRPHVSFVDEEQLPLPTQGRAKDRTE